MKVTLAEVCGKGQYGLVASATDLPVGPKFLRTTDMIDGSINWDAVPYCQVDERKQDQCLLREGDLVISRTGANAGAAAYVADPPEGAVFAGYLVRFRANDSLADARFLGYVLQSREWADYVTNTRTGSAQPQLNAVLMGKFAFDLPPLDEQRRIAEVLGALDDLIDTNELVADRATSLAQNLALRVSDRLVGLSELAELADSRTVVPRGLADHYSLLAFDNGNMPERVDGAEIKSNKTLIDSEVVLVSRLNPHIPRVWAVYPDPSVTSVASTEFVPMRGIDVAVEEVFALVSTDLYLAQLSSRVTGTTGSHQRVDKRALFELLVPDIRRLAANERSVVIELVREANGSREASAELRRTRDELLPLLMSGAVRVRPEGVAA